METNKRGKKRIPKEPVRRRKRSSQQMKKASQRARRIFFSILILFAAGTMVTLSLTVFFLVTQIQVVGNAHYTAEEIVRTSGFQLEENLFRINKGAAAQKMKDNLPYIYETQIRRKLPSVIVISVTESSPVGAIGGGDNEILLDEFGRALEIAPTGTKGKFPAITGADAPTIHLGQGVFTKEQTQKNYSQLIQVLQQTGDFDKITQINVSVPYDLTFSYEDRILVTLGDISDIEAKISSFSLVTHEKIGGQEKGELDISNPDEVHFIPKE